MLVEAAQLRPDGRDQPDLQGAKRDCGDGASAWECLVPRAADILAGWPAAGCDGLVAADKLVYPSMQLRRKTETGDTVTVNNLYRGTDAPAACGSSIYGAVVTIARES